jgi:uncharacterized protein (TIGR00661 family)
MGSLDWGLGHTSRCVPIIRHLKTLGKEITFAGNEWQRDYIERTFPGIETLQLEGYNVQYKMQGNGLVFSVMMQAPAILKSIKKENEWLNNLLRARQFDAIISDNRYGLYHPGIPSVVITHQLEVQTGFGNAANKLFRKLHYRLLNRFSECWVPDAENELKLSGKLGHPDILPDKTKYIGCLSQFEDSETKPADESTLLILLSGIEPQRSLLSKLLWEQALKYEGKLVFVEGSNNVIAPLTIPQHISYHKLLTKNLLSGLMQEAGMVIARSGYSTIMDLAAMRKKAILIPTPGQTEQEYLGRHLHQQGLFYCVTQKDFDLKTVLADARNFPYHFPLMQSAFSQYKTVINNWLGA